ncbi:MAG: signal recognition particle-docking protein FtsY [Candidatus Diapherotrites archaeon]
MFDLLKKKIAGFTEKILGSATSEQNNIGNIHPESVTQTEIEERKKEKEKKNTLLRPIEESTNTKEKYSLPTRETIASLSKRLPEMQEKEEREIKTRVGVFQQIGGIVTGTITLQEETITHFLEEFELSLLEADVEIGTASALVEELQARLTNRTISARENPGKIILKEIKAALHTILPPVQIDFDQQIETYHPCIILILGPNGAGKTTTIAKLTHYLKKKGKKVVWGSADTFRAGSIEQLEIHAKKLGVRLIKHQYGADPAAVAFDAVKASEGDHADVVIIDTAGRQDTNKNLIEELKKINRVVQPQLKIYVGESYTGQAILTQARTFDEAIGIDGFILTKLDTDSKGGGVISILHNLHKPIIFFGTGQSYEDLTRFSLDAFLERLIPTEEQ